MGMELVFPETLLISDKRPGDIPGLFLGVINMNEKVYFNFSELDAGDFFIIKDEVYKPDEPNYHLKISDTLYFSFNDCLLHNPFYLQNKILIVMEYEVY